MSRVDLDGRRIDFRLVREGETLSAKPPKDAKDLKDRPKSFERAHPADGTALAFKSPKVRVPRTAKGAKSSPGGFGAKAVKSAGRKKTQTGKPRRRD